MAVIASSNNNRYLWRVEDLPNYIMLASAQMRLHLMPTWGYWCLLK